jgi:hypothetical protein
VSVGVQLDPGHQQVAFDELKSELGFLQVLTVEASSHPGVEFAEDSHGIGLFGMRFDNELEPATSETRGVLRTPSGSTPASPLEPAT